MKLLIDMPDICGHSYPNCIVGDERKHTAEFISVMESLERSGNKISKQINDELKRLLEKFAEDNRKLWDLKKPLWKGTKDN